jgi:hypothetical protein
MAGRQCGTSFDNRKQSKHFTAALVAKLVRSAMFQVRRIALPATCNGPSGDGPLQPSFRGRRYWTMRQVPSGCRQATPLDGCVAPSTITVP